MVVGASVVVGVVVGATVAAVLVVASSVVATCIASPAPSPPDPLVTAVEQPTIATRAEHDHGANHDATSTVLHHSQ